MRRSDLIALSCAMITIQAAMAQANSATPTTQKDDEWHFTLSPYLWFPGVEGIVGARDRDTHVSASAIDLLSHFRFGLMATGDARWKRLVLPLDLFWVRLGDDKAIPYGNADSLSADIRVGIFVLTPKIGVRVLDREKLKIDALAGARYWHLGQRLQFSPSPLNRNFRGSQDWGDPVVGGRFEASLAPKLVVTVFGDAGGWGTGSEIEYQVGGLLGYRVKENVTLQGGYRYLYVDYRPGGAGNFIFDVHLSGIVFGVTFGLK
jgi:hypothetical protein